MNFGDIATSQVLYFHFTTRQFSTGAPITSASLAISVYKDDSVTQSTSGVTTTFTSGFDSVAGLVSVKIDTSADGTFYAAGHDFSVVATAGTADSVSIVGEVVGYFSIQNRTALRPTTAGRTLDVSAGGEAGLDWANVGSPTTTLALTGTTVAVTQKVDIETIKTNPVVNGGTITFPTTATLASTTNITAGTITTATNLTNAPTSGDLTATMKTSVTTACTASTPTAAAVTGAVGSVTGAVGSVTGSVGSVASGGITATSIAADAIGASELAADAVTEIANAVWSATRDATLKSLTIDSSDGIGLHIRSGADHPMFVEGYSSSNHAAIKAVGNGAGEGMYLVGGFTNGAGLRCIGQGSAADISAVQACSAATISGVVWEETLADHSGVSGSTAEALNAAGSAGDPWNTALPGAYVAGKAGYILGTNLDAKSSDIKAKTNSLTFTTPGQVDANIQSVNDVAVTGTGANGDEWGP